MSYQSNRLTMFMFTCSQVSVFAESFYEMLQYQMGSRVLSFLQVQKWLFYFVLAIFFSCKLYHAHFANLTETAP